MTPWFRTRDRADGILQVVRCGPLNALVNQYVQLVLDALRYAQPVEVRKEWSDVVVAVRANCQACGSVDDGLQTVQVAAWQAGESDVAVVQFCHDEAGDERRQCRLWNRSSDAMNLSKDAEVVTCDVTAS